MGARRTARERALQALYQLEMSDGGADDALAAAWGASAEMEKPDPIFVTIPRAVEVSGCTRTRIYDALKRGDLTARKAGRRTLINYADLQAYLASLPAYGAKA